MALDRGAYIDQSQSMNIHIAEPTYGKLTTILFQAWEGGAKTGSYYIRGRPAADATQVTVVTKDNTFGDLAYVQRNSNTSGVQETPTATASVEKVCNRFDKEGCTSCGS